MYVLNKLWTGEISPMERMIRPGSAYQKTVAEISTKMDILMEALSPEEKTQVEELEDLKGNLNLLAEEEQFLYGFRMGARMMLDIMGEYKGQFCSLSEIR